MNAAAIMLGMLKYQTIPVTPFAQNCSLIWCDETKEAAVIDPGGDLDALAGAGVSAEVRVERVAPTGIRARWEGLESTRLSRTPG